MNGTAPRKPKTTRKKRVEGGGIDELAVKFALKEDVNIGHHFTSEALRNPQLQRRATTYRLRKATPVLQKVGSELLDQLSEKVRPDLDGRGVDVHKLIGKLPSPKRGWTLPGHRYTSPYNPLDSQLNFDLETGEILDIFQQPTGSADAVAVQHDVHYRSCDFRAKKQAKTKKMQARCLPKNGQSA